MERKAMAPAGKKAATKNTHPAPAARKWSARVTHHSNALDLQAGVFQWKDPKAIATSLKRSAEKSKRKKGKPLQSAMSMLNFYIDRAGRNLSAAKRKPLEKAKQELRALFGKRT